MLGAPGVMRFRPLMALLVAPERAQPCEQAYHGPRWAWYQTIRLLILWTALWVDVTAFGVTHAVVAGGLLGLTFRFDYWSNCVEFLAAVLVCSSGVLGIPWWGYLACGLVLGLGRETLPLLGLAAPSGIPLAVGAAATQGALRLWTKQDPGWGQRAEATQYGWSQVRANLQTLRRPRNWAMFAYAGIYSLVACLALTAAPLVSVAAVAVTFAFARIDEPRVLTLLIPFAAKTLCGL